MPKINFGNVPNPGPSQPLPEGNYTCQVQRVDPTRTKHGDEMWRLRLVVRDGPYAGRAVRDNLVFNPEAMPRVKNLCESLNFDTTGEIDLVPDTVNGGVCRVQVTTEEYQGTQKNKVAFFGYSRVSDEGEV